MFAYYSMGIRISECPGFRCLHATNHTQGEFGMTYDFTSLMERHGKDALAVDGLGSQPGFAPDPPKPGFDVIPCGSLT